MTQIQTYSDLANNPVVSILKGVDQDVEHGEDIIMLGYATVLAAPLFAPVLPPIVLLPLMALVFLVCVCKARNHFHNMAFKLKAALLTYQDTDFSTLKPLVNLFAEHPTHTLADGFNPAKNVSRTLKSALGALMINPLWMPIFYLFGMQTVEEKQLSLLNQIVMQLEERTKLWRE